MVHSMSGRYEIVSRYASNISDMCAAFDANKKLPIISMSVAIHLTGILSHVIFAKAIDLPFTIWMIGWIRSACLIAGLFPFSIAGFGVREASLIYLLNLYGATREQAIVYSMLTVAVVFAMGILGGGLELFWLAGGMLITRGKMVGPSWQKDKKA